MMFSIIIYISCIRTVSKNREGYTPSYSSAKGYIFSLSRGKTTRKLYSTNNNKYIWRSK
jgi:hypothetical protein